MSISMYLCTLSIYHIYIYLCLCHISHLSTPISVCLYVYLSLSAYLYLSISMSIYMYIHVYLPISVCLSIHPTPTSNYEKLCLDQTGAAAVCPHSCVRDRTGVLTTPECTRRRDAEVRLTFLRFGDGHAAVLGLGCGRRLESRGRGQTWCRDTNRYGHTDTDTKKIIRRHSSVFMWRLMM